MTKTELANNALGHIGEATINDIDSTSSVNAKKCNAAYPKTRQAFIRDADPSFARKELALSELTGESSVLFDYVYAYPSDCLKARYIWNGTKLLEPRIVHKTGRHSSGTSKTILTDQDEATLIYSVDVDNLDMFTVDDTNAMEWYMAMILATTIKRDQSLADRMLVKYGLALEIAKKNNMRDQKVEMPEDTDYTDSRFG